MTEVPASLVTPITKRGRGPRRARSNIPGKRASTFPAIHPGDIVFRLVPDGETLRAWGRKYGFQVKNRGPVPQKIREHFDTYNTWSVQIVTVQPPGAKQPGAYYKVMEGLYERRLTDDKNMIKRDMGPELFALLRQVNPDGTPRPLRKTRRPRKERK